MLSNLVIRGFAAWRLAHMFVYESGPFSLFVKLREATGIEHDEQGAQIKWPDESVLHCVWCLSVWFAFILTFLPIKVSEIFAVAGVAAFLESKNGES